MFTGDERIKNLPSDREVAKSCRLHFLISKLKLPDAFCVETWDEVLIMLQSQWVCKPDLRLSLSPRPGNFNELLFSLF